MRKKLVVFALILSLAVFGLPRTGLRWLDQHVLSPVQTPQAQAFALVDDSFIVAFVALTVAATGIQVVAATNTSSADFLAQGRALWDSFSSTAGPAAQTVYDAIIDAHNAGRATLSMPRLGSSSISSIQSFVSATSKPVVPQVPPTSDLASWVFSGATLQSSYDFGGINRVLPTALYTNFSYSLSHAYPYGWLRFRPSSNSWGAGCSSVPLSFSSSTGSLFLSIAATAGNPLLVDFLSHTYGYSHNYQTYGSRDSGFVLNQLDLSNPDGEYLVFFGIGIDGVAAFSGHSPISAAPAALSSDVLDGTATPNQSIDAAPAVNVEPTAIDSYPDVVAAPVSTGNDVLDGVNSLGDQLAGVGADVLTGVRTLGDQLVGIGSDVLTGAQSIVDTLTGAVTGAIGAVGSAVSSIPAAIGDVLGFNPDGTMDTALFELPADISKIFPFCIPFDIFDIVSALSAAPVAPVFDWTVIGVNGLVPEQTVHVDLSPFDDVAAVLRVGELLLFGVGLAFVTRYLIKS